ncbi:MAG: hypothetical protein JWO44_2123 [Bacteroidetes bacterium]|nr:hypothetical protein [Bacteroidota bacterium]
MLTSKQKLMLLFIDSGFSNNQYTLIKHFDRFDFPAELGVNLRILKENGLISVSGHHPANGTEFEYVTTDKGKKFTESDGFYDEIMNYIKKLDQSGHFSQITETLIRKRLKQ